MSNSEQPSPSETGVNSSIVKPILKKIKPDFQSLQPRIDQAGNKIVKGGNHKITFREEAKVISQSKHYIIESDSSESEDEQCRNLTSSNTLEQVKIIEKRGNKTQPTISEDSRCCTIF